MPLHDLTALQLLDGYAKRSLSPVDVMRAVLARVEAFEPKIHATYLVNPERALDEARRSETRWTRGSPLGGLDGVPVTIKDNIATRGEPKPSGTAASELDPEPEDAPPAARLREAGAILFAKTTMPDYGMLSSGLSSFHPLTRNPWNLERNPGGSSAGASAAAAAGYGPLHLGTDIGGSVRLPAAWCGVFGLKPSFGRIPIDPPYFGRVAGPITRSVADAALMMATLSKPDARDYMSLKPEALDWPRAPLEVAGLRIGLMLETGCGWPPQDDVRAEIERAGRDLAAAGAVVVPLAPFLSQDMLDGLDCFWRMRLLTEIKALPPERREKVLPFILDWAESARGLDGEDVYRGFTQMLEMRRCTIAATAPFDFVISPTAPMPPFSAELASPSDDPLDPFPHVGFTVAFSMSEQPAASVNCGFTADGLPIGLQIVGQRFDDVGVIGLALAFEEMRAGDRRPWPEP